MNTPEGLNREPECELCGSPYALRDGCEPTPYCDACAHVAVERLTRELAAVKAERDALLPPAPHSVVITQLRERAEKAESALAQAERRGMERARWIPVAERLPEDHKPMQHYLVCDINNPLLPVRMCSTHPDWWNHKDGRGHDFDGPTVTHWMMPPEPPNESAILAVAGAR